MGNRTLALRKNNEDQQAYFLLKNKRHRDFFGEMDLYIGLVISSFIMLLLCKP